jgi:phosphoribosylformimino-5-aminoimidazole carboxamide ribotide isomerase
VIVIPAIDIKDGRCVRLRQGRMDDVTVFADDPIAMARHWLELGCRRLHVVDLDGALAGAPRNTDVIGRIVALAASVPVQIGGGVRDVETIARYFDAGAAHVIVGTRAVEEPEFLVEQAGRYPAKLLMGLDARGDRIATRGWEGVSAKKSLVEFATWCAQLPIAGIVYTDIDRDGMSSGLNVARTIALAEATGIPVIASGGIGTLADLEALQIAARASTAQLLGVITGRALYEGTLDLPAAQQLLDRATRR